MTEYVPYSEQIISLLFKCHPISFFYKLDIFLANLPTNIRTALTEAQLRLEVNLSVHRHFSSKRCMYTGKQASPHLAVQCSGVVSLPNHHCAAQPHCAHVPSAVF